jgi:Holliday junction resolvasome RuvABC DNA-binding subunit
VLALIALGFKQVEAHEAVRGAVAALGPKAMAENLVRACLKKGG